MSLKIGEVRVPTPLSRARKVYTALLNCGDSKTYATAGGIDPNAAVAFLQPDEAGMAMTLADGTHPGETMRIMMETQSDPTYTAVLTPTTLLGGTTLTFDAVDEYAVLLWTATGWYVRTATATLA